MKKTRTPWTPKQTARNRRVVFRRYTDVLIARQFALLDNLSPRRRQYPFLLVLQPDRVSSVGSIVSAPLTEASAALAETRLHPVLELHGRRYVVLIEQLAAVPRTYLGPVAGTADAQRYAIVAALDLFTGI